MKFTLIDCDQRSEEWRAARLGRLTGSRAAHMMAKIKSGEAAARRNLRVGLALERVTKRPYERAFTARTTQQGVDLEPAAVGMYEVRTGNMIERTGFLSGGPVQVGCSLDGHVNDFEGIIEVKCPESATHLEYLRTRIVPADYGWQCMHNMWVSGAQWCDFISFDPSFPEDLQFMCVRLWRDDKQIAAYAEAAGKFLAEVAVEVDEIKKLRAA